MATLTKEQLDSAWTAAEQAEIREMYKRAPDDESRKAFMQELMKQAREKGLFDTSKGPRQPGDPIDKGLSKESQKDTGPRKPGDPIDKGLDYKAPGIIKEKIDARQFKAIDRLGEDGKIYNTFVGPDGSTYFGNGTRVPEQLLASSAPQSYKPKPKRRSPSEPEPKREPRSYEQQMKENAAAEKATGAKAGQNALVGTGADSAGAVDSAGRKWYENPQLMSPSNLAKADERLGRIDEALKNK